MSGNGRRRVVVTGLGAVTPLGTDVESTWTGLIAGRSGAGKITQFDTSGFPVDFGCEVPDFEPTTWMDYKAARRMDRFAQLAVAAARQAEADAGIDIAADAERIGAAIATGIGGLKSFEACVDVLNDRGPDRVNPFAIVQIIPNLAAGWVSMELGTKGPLLSECTACAASNMAIGDGLDAIRLGRADVMLCGGTEAPISRVGIAGFGPHLHQRATLEIDAEIQPVGEEQRDRKDREQRRDRKTDAAEAGKIEVRIVRHDPQ